ncbi:MAG: hypothetical protein ACLR4N_09825 [Mediterraneibacter faecis]
MENKLLKEYLGEFNEDSDVSIIIANPKDRKMYKSEIMFMIAPEDEEEKEGPVICIEVGQPRDMDKEKNRKWQWTLKEKHSQSCQDLRTITREKSS